MTNVLMILKTQSLKNDQRILKELASFKKLGANVDVFVAKDCDLSQSQFNYTLYEARIFGGAAPSKMIVRIIGILHFYIKAMSFILYKDYSVVWVCDPIMFLLVLALKKIKPELKVVWDHHELPPSWFLESKYLTNIFKIAYRKTDIVIHANKYRQDFLEKHLNVKARKSYIISNYPDANNTDEAELTHEAECWIKNAGSFVYLQNSLQENRYGFETITALLESGYKVFHAGKINKVFLDKYKLYSNDLYLSGYLNINQINRVLNKCDFTVIFYKQNSLNQIYCDANRLYQAMSLGVPVIIGNNPTLVGTTSDYNDVLVLDNINRHSIKEIVNEVGFKQLIRKPEVLKWSEYDDFFQEILI
ncbi:glycosyltransferase [Psychrobacter sp. DAB_AL62B]|uniref:glycosyltransferase n=1 Tax=Psychrobacter sp. DAB_AL62B TaxID=1028420 RepID=UPI0023810957|nr:glycosyltransferase [Psychrobacter sp. DAB_AL62B]MDE4455139.1 glycosyl transferase family 1 [Psychrobacter sp. DAB_AL62B]